MSIKFNHNLSRRKTPWDEQSDLSSLQKFIRDKYIDTYNVRHPDLSQSIEISFLNSLDIETCKLCSSPNIQKYGHT